MTKQVVIFSTAVMTTLLALVVLWQFRVVLVYIMVSLALAATVRPFVVGWKKNGSMIRLLLILLYLLILGGFGLLILFAGRYVVGDMQQFALSQLMQGGWMFPHWLEGSLIQSTLSAWLPTPDKLFTAVTGEQGQLVLPAMLNFSEGFGGVISGILLVLFLSVYWSINQIHFERLWLSLLPAEQRKHARSIWRTIEIDLGAYIRSEIMQSVLAALLLGFGYWLLGSQYPVLLALIGALAWLVPVVGALLAIITPLIIGLSTSLQLGVFTALYTLIILIALQIWVEPRLFRRKWDNPILTLIILLALADMFGLPGILVAPPLSAACQISWSMLVSNRLASGAAVQIMDLKERQAQLLTVISGMNESPPPLVMSSMERLTSLIEKAEPILPTSVLTTDTPGLTLP